MRSAGLRLGSIRGVPLILTPGWGLITIVLVVLFTPTVRRVLALDVVPAAAVALGVPLLLAVSVLLHELAHGLTAQRLGVRVREYVLSLWGGHTAFHSEIGRPGASALVAVVGPATNAVLAMLLWWLAGVVQSGVTSQGSAALALVVSVAAYTNAFVAVFNALPALPMDGGRLLEAAVWKARGDRDLGTLVAARVGQGVAVLVVVGGLARGAATSDWVTAIWAVLIGAMLWQGATGAVRVATARRATRDVDLTAWMVPVTVLPAEAPVTALAGVAGSVVLTAGPDGVPTGQVLPDAVRAVPVAAREHTALLTVTTPVPADALLTEHRGSEAVAQLAQAARAGARVAVLVGLDRRAIGAVDVVDAAKRLPR